MENKPIKKYFYTDGVKTIKLPEGSPIPEGFRKGRTFKVNTWNKGLKASEDERVRLNHEHATQTRKKNNNYTSWNKGLTKENNESLNQVSIKMSEYRKGKSSWNKGIPMKAESKLKLSQANKGKTAWNKGLTKETDVRLLGTSQKQKGHKDYVTDWAKAKEKEYQTRKINKTFNTSKPEDELYNKLCITYGKEDVIHIYRSEKYNHNCDFYIKSKELYIELNYHWSHGGHPFNPDNPEDIEKLNIWKQKALEHKQYAYAIKVWTESDVQKLNDFNKNKLNYQIIYPNKLIISNINK